MSFFLSGLILVITVYVSILGFTTTEFRKQYSSLFYSSLIVSFFLLVGLGLLDLSYKQESDKTNKTELKTSLSQNTDLVMDKIDSSTSELKKISTETSEYTRTRFDSMAKTKMPVEKKTTTFRPGAYNQKTSVNKEEISEAELPIVTVATPKDPCAAGYIDGCWKLEAEANIGDTVGVQISFKNEFGFNQADFWVWAKPLVENRVTSELIFRGGYVNGKKNVGGVARIKLSRPGRVEFMRATIMYDPQTPLNVPNQFYFSPRGLNVPLYANQNAVMIINYRIVEP